MDIYEKLKEIAALLGCEVYEVPFKHVNGLIRFYNDDDERPIIGIADKLSDDVKPHILAHEIGHLLLHYGQDLVTFRNPFAEREATELGEHIIRLLEIRATSTPQSGCGLPASAYHTN